LGVTIPVTSGLSPSSCIYIDAQPFSWTLFAGIPRSTARLALAAHVQVRFFHAGQEPLPPPHLGWSQDQDLESWGRKLWRGRRRPLGTPAANCIGLYCSVRPSNRTFPYEVSILHDFCVMVVPWSVPNPAPGRDYAENGSTCDRAATCFRRQASLRPLNFGSGASPVVSARCSRQGPCAAGWGVKVLFQSVCDCSLSAGHLAPRSDTAAREKAGDSSISWTGSTLTTDTITSSHLPSPKARTATGHRFTLSTLRLRMNAKATSRIGLARTGPRSRPCSKRLGSDQSSLCRRLRASSRDVLVTQARAWAAAWSSMLGSDWQAPIWPLARRFHIVTACLL